MTDNLKYAEVMFTRGLTKEKYGGIMYARGYAEGYVECYTEAKGEQVIKAVKNLIEMNTLTIEQIAQGVGLTVEDVPKSKRQ